MVQRLSDSGFQPEFFRWGGGVSPLSTLASSHCPDRGTCMMLIIAPVGVNVSVTECLSLDVGPVMDCRPMQRVPCPPPPCNPVE